jgi:type VI secretion system protein ImpF
MASRINPTLFDKLVADLHIDGVREVPQGELELSRASMRFYAVPRIERFNEAALRATVLRELSWILNTTNLNASQPLDETPEVATSVLNYGVADMSGKLLSPRAVRTRAREIRDAITTFEPRMHPDHLDVEAKSAPERPNAVTFVIRGDVAHAVSAMPVEFKTDVEIDTGAAILRE